MRPRLGAFALAAALAVAGCAAPPPAAPEEYDEPGTTSSSTALAEPQPIEPVEPLPLPPPARPAPEPQPQTAVAPAPPARDTAIAMAAPAILPPPAPPIPVPVPELSAEEVAMNALLADLQRYVAMPGDEARREINTVTQMFGRQRTDANRIRLAMLYTMTRNGTQDDQRALQLLDNVAKSGPGMPAVKQLAQVLQVQISERVRAVRDEQQKADAAIQKLEALRSMERSLLRDRVRGGGGGGGGGSSGGAGGGGSSGGAGG